MELDVLARVTWRDHRSTARAALETLLDVTGARRWNVEPHALSTSWVGVVWAAWTGDACVHIEAVTRDGIRVAGEAIATGEEDGFLLGRGDLEGAPTSWWPMRSRVG